MGAMGLIRKNEPGIYTLNERESLTDIRTGTRCNNDSDRHTMRIHGQIILVLSPFCAAHVLITVFYHANDKNGDEYFSSHHIPVEGLAMERLSVKSKRLH